MKVIKQKVELLNNLFYEQMVQNVVSASNQCWKTGCLFDGTLAEGEKIIYFSNHTLTEADAIKKFDVPKSAKVGVSFSKEEKKKNLKQKLSQLLKK